MPQSSFTPLSLSTASSWVTLEPNGLYVSGRSQCSTPQTQSDRHCLLRPFSDIPFVSRHHRLSSSPGSTSASDDCHQMNTVHSEWSILCVERSPTSSSSEGHHGTPTEESNQIRFFPTCFCGCARQNLLPEGVTVDPHGSRVSNAYAACVCLRPGSLRGTVHSSLRPQRFPYGPTNHFSPLSQVVAASVFGRYISQQLSTVHVGDGIGSESDVDTSAPSRGSSPFAASHASWEDVGRVSCDEHGSDRVSEATHNGGGSPSGSGSDSESGLGRYSLFADVFFSIVMKGVKSGTETPRTCRRRSATESPGYRSGSDEDRGWSAVSRWFATNVEPLVVCTVYSIMVFVL